MEITDKDLVWQLKKVMRAELGERIVLFDGKTVEAVYKIQEFIGRGTINLKLLEIKEVLLNRKKLIIGTGLIKSQSRQEWMIEKLAEIGVDVYIPLVTDNTDINKLKKRARLEKIVIEACEQSGRVILMDIMGESRLQELSELYSKFDYLKIVADGSDRGPNLMELICQDGIGGEGVVLLVGPPGGWSQKEKHFFQREKWLSGSLGKNVLRAETAAILGAGMVEKLIQG